MSFEDKNIEVCDSCSRACCWYGEFMCDESASGGTTLKKVSELRKLNFESEHYWKSSYMTKVYGDPDPFREEVMA